MRLRISAPDQNQESGTSRLQPHAGSILDGTIASAQRRFSGGALQSPRGAMVLHDLKMPGLLLRRRALTQHAGTHKTGGLR